MSSSTKETEEKLKFTECQVSRRGTMIIIPEGMSYSEAREWIRRQMESEEKNVAINATIPCFPLDGVVALSNALVECYGHVVLSDTPSFFGPKPPIMVQIETPRGLITAPIGRIQPPMYEGGFFNTQPSEMALVISGEVKRKFEGEVKRVIEKTKELLAKDSIYRGNAIILDLSYIEEERDFHPVKDAPRFMDVRNVDENGVIMNESVQQRLEACIYGRIEQSDAFEANGIPLKHTALFSGKFGTGKTLTSRVIASKAVRNGWTFIYLKTITQTALALKMAEQYSPCVLFAEDIDLVTSGERDDKMNEILNTLDGVDTKDQKLITILTTNNEEKIEKAMLRAGRIDTLVRFTYPDAKSAVRFVRMYATDDDGKCLLAEMTEEEEKQVGEALSGKIPAFIAEAVKSAKCFAVAKYGKDIAGKITGHAIVNEANEQKAQLDLLEGQRLPSLAEKTFAAVRHIGVVQLDHRQQLADNGSVK